ncbi:DNA-binding transcriptional MerR regulator [Paenibacillus castaneae]|nr:YhbD family protein [Paenibacillus castaneae]NIK76525.1 DNA-binding transcriptional MerR regulator [Paenibacillus castaneae]
MDKDLISKKELLDLTGISYGQLYRWKRKKLIPEDWFIRKSTFTGQETFFPKQTILARIHNIINMKDGLSLDELADKLSDMSSLNSTALTAEDIVSRNIVSQMTLNKFGNLTSGQSAYSFEQLIILYTVDYLLSSGEMSLEEAELLSQTLVETAAKFEGKSWDLYFVRKMGVTSFILALSPSELVFDEGVRLVNKLSLGDLLEQLKGKLS